MLAPAPFEPSLPAAPWRLPGQHLPGEGQRTVPDLRLDPAQTPAIGAGAVATLPGRVREVVASLARGCSHPQVVTPVRVGEHVDRRPTVRLQISQRSGDLVSDRSVVEPVEAQVVPSVAAQ